MILASRQPSRASTPPAPRWVRPKSTLAARAMRARSSSMRARSAASRSMRASTLAMPLTSPREPPRVPERGAPWSPSVCFILLTRSLYAATSNVADLAASKNSLASL